ncbi:putative adhesin [Halorubrum virus HRTV-11]|nr:putative adhesin [Halorubrum virus HRTV-11]
MVNINFGSGRHGDKVVSTDETLTNQYYLEYNNLTVEAGATLTLPSDAVVFVKEQAIIDGTLKIPDGAGIPGGSGGNGEEAGGSGSPAGGTLNILAKSLKGSGVIEANSTTAGSGSESNNSSNNNNSDTNGNSGGVGAGYSIGSSSLSADTPPQPGNGGNANSGGNAGHSGISVLQDGNLPAYIEDLVVAGTTVSGIPQHRIRMPSGAGGGGAGRDDHNKTGGGGGGGGGGSITGSSYGGDGQNRNYGSGNNGNKGGGGGGGGGAGGFISLASEDLESNITVKAAGGDGGDGTFGSGANGAGGAGGSGGLVVAIADTTPEVVLPGGTGGDGYQSGTNGPEGFLVQYGIGDI